MRAAMAACAAISLPLMLIFDSAPTRVIGVLTLFGFIVCGVFAIAHPDFLTPAEEPANGPPPRGVSGQSGEET